MFSRLERGKRSRRFGGLAVSSLLLMATSGCSDMGYTGSGIDLPDLDTSKMSPSAVGATTGAVLGAGLGTIVGSASGNAGEGLVLGSMVGAAAGGAVGYGMEDTQEKISSQQKALDEQQELLGRQSQEISDLKGRLDDRGGKFSRSSKSVKRGGALTSRGNAESKSLRATNLARNDVLARSDVGHSVPVTKESASSSDDSWLDPKGLNTNSAGADAEDPANPPTPRHVSESISEQSINIPDADDVSGTKSLVGNASVAAVGGVNAFPPARSMSQPKAVRDDVDWIDDSVKSSAVKDMDKKTHVSSKSEDLEEGIKTKRGRLAMEKSDATKSKKLEEGKKSKEKQLKEKSSKEAGVSASRKDLETKKLSKAEKARLDEASAKSEKSEGKSVKSAAAKAKAEKLAEVSADSTQTATEKSASKESAKIDQTRVVAEKAASEKMAQEKIAQEKIAESDAASKVMTAKDDPSCLKADEEAKRAATSKSAADKLFYYRRALRVCPSEAKYHYEIGRVYSVIGRNEDAIYELRQALDLNPGMSEAKAELGKLGGQ